MPSDCLEIVNNINRGGSPVYGLIWNEIAHRKREFDEVSFCFEHRESNFEDHALANAVSSLQIGRHVWLGLVPDIICIPDTLIFLNKISSYT